MLSFIIAQILGGIALVFACWGYFAKSKTQFLIFQIIANLFYACSFLVQSALVGGIIVLVSIIRCVYLFIVEKHAIPTSNWMLALFITAYAIIGIAYFQSPLDIIPIITASLFTIAYGVKNLQLTRYLCLPPNILLMVYCIFAQTYTNALLDLLEVVVLIFALIKFHHSAKLNKN